jgi:hypothetical protein
MTSTIQVRLFLAAASTCSLLLPAVPLKANLLAFAEFSTFANGDLVGQNSWQAYGSATVDPIQVSGGLVGWAGGRTYDSQDAVLVFPQQVTQPAEGTTILHYDLKLSVSAAGANPSYFAALNTLTSTDTSGNFQNARLVARTLDDGFQFGARVNGQGGYPFAYGTDKLSFNTDYALRAEIFMVAGNANDYINLYIGPDFDNLSLYATAVYGTGTVADPLYGGIILSQFGSSTVNESGVSFSSVSVTLVPEPSAYAALLGLAALAWFARRRRGLQA